MHVCERARGREKLDLPPKEMAITMMNFLGSSLSSPKRTDIPRTAYTTRSSYQSDINQRSKKENRRTTLVNALSLKKSKASQFQTLSAGHSQARAYI